MKKRIIWERVDSNTFKNESSSDDDDDGIEFNESPQEGGGMNELFLNMSNNVDHTLLGTFHKDHIRHPDNLYSYDFMYLGHLIGFNCNSKNFYTIKDGRTYATMELIEGVAIWKVIDSHKIVFIPAKYYEVEDVIDNIAKELELDVNLDDLDKLDDEDIDKIPLDVIDKCIDISESYGEKYHLVMYLPNKKIISCTEDDNDFEERVEEYRSIHNAYKDESILIIDGEIV